MAKGNGKRRVCACGCGKKFKPNRPWQLYIDKDHRNRHAQQKYRERYTEMQKELDEQAIAGSL